MIRSTSVLPSVSPGTIAPASMAESRHVQPQVGLAMTGVPAVAGEAVLREDRPDVAVEVDLGRRLRE